MYRVVLYNYNFFSYKLVGRNKFNPQILVLMMEIFVSVGTGLNPQQRAFVDAVENKLKALNLTPRTIGRNTFSSFSPLYAISELMNRCSGMVVIALERYSFSEGVERQGSENEKKLVSIKLPTSWNQIEAAMAYDRKMPLLVIVEEGLYCDGLLEKGSEWYVQQLPIDTASLNNNAFDGILNDWRDRLSDPQLISERISQTQSIIDPEKMTIAEFFKILKITHIWTILGVLITILIGAYTFGAKFGRN
ncbi:hypothetical protein [Acetobacter sp.]|uniref:hypothetical protein n=1 Tax=Acetobacter sp. TaxID=440 RepID=UPI0025C0BC5D|nr:hypothetical protein [Acetobacter sp.]MCH4090118.1 hypothetical protein [Acetobacter sp.]MCI1298814.1 hypothetical protein [Acetobacter sp.]MCI1314833.1 hypothetical protein [Acetobacter sp.]